MPEKNKIDVDKTAIDYLEITLMGIRTNNTMSVCTWLTSIHCKHSCKKKLPAHDPTTVIHDTTTIIIMQVQYRVRK